MSHRSFISSKPLGRFVLFAWMIIIAWLSLDPAPPVPEPGILGWDKFLHAVAYGCLTLFGSWALPGKPPLSASRWALVACAVLVVGGLMEVLQRTVTTTRTADFYDLAADFVGVAIVLLAVFVSKKFWSRLAK